MIPISAGGGGSPRRRIRAGRPRREPDGSRSRSAQAGFDRVERGAERTLAGLRVLNYATLWAVFTGAGARELDHALSFSLAGYGAITAFGVICTLLRFHRPWLPWLLATMDVGLLLHCQAMFATTPGWSLDHALMAPGAAMISLILVTTAVRHRPWLVLYTAGLYIVGWLALWSIANADVIASAPDLRSILSKALADAVLLVVVGLVALSLFVSVRYAKHHLLTSLAERDVRQELARFVPPPLVQALTDSNSSGHQAALRDVAVFMIDIHGFTALAERMAPLAVLELLDDFRAVIERTVAEHGGTIDKYIGDAALVVFGAEEDSPAGAAEGLAWARRIGPEIATWNASSTERPRIEIAVGGHWGPVVAGVVGKGERREFTVLGDTVNVCARIQQLASAGDLPLVVSEDLLRAAGVDVAGGSWRELPETSLRGRQATIRLLRDAAETSPGRQA